MSATTRIWSFATPPHRIKLLVHTPRVSQLSSQEHADVTRGRKGGHHAPRSQQEEQNMLDLALALSMCESETATRLSSRTPSPTGTPDTAQGRRSPHLPHPSTSGITAPPAPTHPRVEPSPPAADPTPSAPPLSPQPADATATESGAARQRYTARTVSGRTRNCNSCKKPLAAAAQHGHQPQDVAGHVTGVEIGGHLYHPACVRCKACGDPITAMHVRYKGALFHERCHRRKYGIICDCCHERIAAEGHMVRFLPNTFWRERYCPRHEHDGSVACTGCARLRRPESDDIAELGDGRSICLECLHTIVPDTAAAQPLYREVVDFYRSQLSMEIPEVPPLMLVENSGLNEARDREGRPGADPGPATHTRGLCLIERVTFVQTGRIARDDNSGALVSKFEDTVSLRVDPNTVVVAIIVLAGLPRVMTGAVIAHELMHAWLREHGIRKLPNQVEEGLCQLMSYLWVEAQQLEDDVMQARLASYVGYQVRVHPSEVYGKGFVLALEAYQRLGLKALLEHVRLTRMFPMP